MNTSDKQQPDCSIQATDRETQAQENITADYRENTSSYICTISGFSEDKETATIHTAKGHVYEIPTEVAQLLIDMGIQQQEALAEKRSYEGCTDILDFENFWVIDLRSLRATNHRLEKEIEELRAIIDGVEKLIRKTPPERPKFPCSGVYEPESEDVIL